MPKEANNSLCTENCEFVSTSKKKLELTPQNSRVYVACTQAACSSCHLVMGLSLCHTSMNRSPSFELEFDRRVSCTS